MLRRTLFLSLLLSFSASADEQEKPKKVDPEASLKAIALKLSKTQVRDRVEPYGGEWERFAWLAAGVPGNVETSSDPFAPIGKTSSDPTLKIRYKAEKARSEEYTHTGKIWWKQVEWESVKTAATKEAAAKLPLKKTSGKSHFMTAALRFSDGKWSIVDINGRSNPDMLGSDLKTIKDWWEVITDALAEGKKDDGQK